MIGVEQFIDLVGSTTVGTTPPASY